MITQGGREACSSLPIDSMVLFLCIMNRYLSKGCLTILNEKEFEINDLKRIGFDNFQCDFKLDNFTFYLQIKIVLNLFLWRNKQKNFLKILQSIITLNVSNQTKHLCILVPELIYHLICTNFLHYIWCKFIIIIKQIYVITLTPSKGSIKA